MKHSAELGGSEANEESVLAACRALLREAGADRAPVNLRLLASFRGIRSITEVPNFPYAGMLEPVAGGGANVYLRADDSLARKNFSLAHEIVHTLLPQYELRPQMRRDEETGIYNRSNDEEYLCDIGASELLLPSNLFYPALKEMGFGPRTLKKLSESFNASLEATARKMVNADPATYGMIIWEERHKPSEQEILASQALPGFEPAIPKEKLRVASSAGLIGMGHIPKNKSLSEKGGIITRSLEESQPCSGLGEIDFGTFKLSTEIHALPYRLKGVRRVLSLLHLQE